MAHILVVDDDADIKDLMEFYLVKKGYDVATASDGRGALDFLEKSRTDLIIMDMLMPQMDGVQTVEEMSKNPIHKDVPVIMMSGARDEMDVIKGLMDRSIRYIEKPFSHDKLLLMIQEVLRQRVCGS